MNKEFHYYMTYLISARAGFQPHDAEIIARSAESVDDNHILYRVMGDSGEVPYENRISQTMDIMKPEKALLKIYPIFHFIPGNPEAPSAVRKDGRKDPWVTTPDSPISRDMLNSALASRNLYRIGIAAHAYADTWAHQNFVGRNDTFNSMWSFLGFPKTVGHAHAGHQPDMPALVWEDPRLVNSNVDNRIRFLDAAQALFRHLALYIDPTRNEDWLAREAAELRSDLNSDIGPADPDSESELRELRLVRYCERALQEKYGRTRSARYKEFGWVNEAVDELAAELRQWLIAKADIVCDFIVDGWDNIRGHFTGKYRDKTDRICANWRNPSEFQDSHWYQFVEAVREHQNECWEILVSSGLPGLSGDEKGASKIPIEATKGMAPEAAE